MIDVAFAAFGGAWLAIFMLVFIVVGVIANELDSFFMSAATLLIGFVGMQCRRIHVRVCLGVK